MSQATSPDRHNFETCNDKFCWDIAKSEWQKVAGGVPGNELRDYIMSHCFDELFELVDSPAGEKPEARVKKRKIHEIEQAILEQIRPGKAKGLGVFVRAVDIGRIEFSGWAEGLMLGHWGEPWIQDIRKIQLEGGARLAEFLAQAMVIEARAKAQSRILEGQGEGEARAAFVREALQEIRRYVPIADEEVAKFVLPDLIKAMRYMDDWKFDSERRGGKRRRGRRRRKDDEREEDWREDRKSLPLPPMEANGTGNKAEKSEQK
jgi:hypothetical protein